MFIPWNGGIFDGLFCENTLIPFPLNNVPNGHNTQFRQQGQTHKFNQFNGRPSGNGINVFSQNKPSNMPPFQGINMMTPNQHEFLLLLLLLLL
jgi:hypothetical protein